MASRNITDLHPHFQGMVTELLRRGSEVVAPYTFFITDGYRSMEEQAQLYARGRTAPGSIVTHAKPGESAHNYGLAADLAFQKDGKLTYDDALYQKVYSIARDLGFVLGADWTKFRDRPHFEYPNWHSLVNQKPAPLPTHTPTVTASHRNITITHAIGSNVRVEPSTTSKIVTKLVKGTDVAVKGWVEGEEVAGVNKWWIASNGTYIWAGATNVIPQASTQPAVSAPAASLPTPHFVEPQTAVASMTPIGEELVPKKLLTERDNQIRELTEKNEAQKELLRESLDAIQKLQTLTSNTVAVKNTNESLAAQIDAKDAQLKTVKEKLKVAYAQAFAQWELIELSKGSVTIGQRILTVIKVVKVLFDAPRSGYVLGWKKGAKLHTTTPQSEPPQIPEAVLNKVLEPTSTI